MSVTADETRKTGFPVAFLILEERDPKRGTIWRGRCVLAGCLSEGSSRQGAVDCLLRAVDRAVQWAVRDGLTPKEWFDSLEATGSDLTAAFCRAACGGIETRTFDMRHSECSIVAGIATAHAS